MVKNLRERLAEKRATTGERPERTAVATVADPMGCKTCGVLIKSGVYCDVCFAIRVQMRGDRRPEPNKETKPVSTPITVGNGSKPTTDAAPAVTITPDRVRAIRKRQNMSQDQLGKQLGVTGTSIANWEARRTTPSAKYVSQLLELENLPPKPKPAPAPYPIPDPAETRAQLAEYRAKKAAEETIEPPATVAGTVPVFDADARRLAEAQNLTDDDPEPAILPDFPSNLTVDTVEADPEDSGRIADMEHDINAAVAFAKHLESRLRVVEREQEPARVLYPPITTNLDAFRLLVRTFGIDTADQVVDLLRG